MEEETVEGEIGGQGEKLVWEMRKIRSPEKRGKNTFCEEGLGLRGREDAC
jgi:hypothetical protein